MNLHQLWQAVLTEEDELKHDFVNLKELFTKRIETLLARPGLIRPVFGFLREHDPIFTAPGIAVVSRYSDVLEVLSNDAAFAVAEIYAAKMERTTGDFVLGMDNTPQYRLERDLMEQAVRPEDLETIRALVDAAATEIVDQARPIGSLDLVDDLTRRVPALLVGKYFGTPGPNVATLNRWMRSIFRDIFLNLSNDGGLRGEADAAAAELGAYMTALIAERKQEIAANPDAFDDYLSRLIKMQASRPADITDDVIVRILGGIIVGTVDTNSKAIAQAVEQLIERPEEMAAARDAVGDDALFSTYVFEALRFNPQNPFLLRHCTADTTIGAGTDHAKLIRAGTTVVVGTMSAMFDSRMVQDPDQFRIDRPADNYIHFGFGMHTCFGKHIGGVLIPLVAKAVVRLNGLRRAPGGDGQMQYDGAFPNRMIVEFDS